MRVAKLWRQTDQQVFVVTRSPQRAMEFSDQGYFPRVADVCDPDQLAVALQGVEIDTVLFAVGYDRSSGQPIHEVYVEGLANLLATLSDTVQTFIYISSTGVYGAGDGDWVDEHTPCQPLRDGGKACLAAEELLRASRFGDRSIILRLAGIYGPDRIPRSKSLLAGEPIDAPATGYLNLIHVDDAARIVLLSESSAPRPALFCVSDGNAVVRSDYYQELARLLGAPPPRFVEPSPDSPAALRAGSDKRVSNQKLMNILAPEFLYPTYREGLAAIVGQVSCLP